MWLQLAGIAGERCAYGAWMPGAGLQGVLNRPKGPISDDEADALEGWLTERLSEVEGLLHEQWPAVQRVAHLFERERNCTRAEIVRAYKNGITAVSLFGAGSRS